ncbi:hypothetical protein NLI96_g11942 [Meripilus lineatus]|uniref:GH16 domain-containing protein n=1 Tax=Meripilus lineatus TaxID=2056292 RepID=A0AAD5Y8P3_9APHY|nr:hypothetical protein NLI96_g11942 [Physisporinus lineatus]
MKVALSLVTLFAASPALAQAANFSLVHAFEGSSFFDGWTFYDFYDNTTNGDVNYVSQANATAMKLAYVNDAGNAIIKVDNITNVPYPEKRDSVRITTNDFYNLGSIWVFDALHLPYGCSVWPSFWTKGYDWPRQGEIDIVEGINLQSANQMALHSYAGCTAASGTTQTGRAGNLNCNSTDGAGCTVTETSPNSFGAGFASAGGGVWATQFDSSGVFIWFWERSKVPASLSSATTSVDISTWGAPSAAYPASSCNVGNFFGPQQLVITLTLCGDWAGIPSLYQPACGGDGAANGCYVNSVINAGSPNFDNAYFEIRSIKVFGVNSSVEISPSSASAAAPSQATGGAAGGSSPTGSGSSGPTGSAGTNAAIAERFDLGGVLSLLGAGVLALASGLLL